MTRWNVADPRALFLSAVAAEIDLQSMESDHARRQTAVKARRIAASAPHPIDSKRLRVYPDLGGNSGALFWNRYRVRSLEILHLPHALAVTVDEKVSVFGQDPHVSGFKRRVQRSHRI